MRIRYSIGTVVAMCVFVAMVLASCALADTTDTVYQYRYSTSDWSPFVIEPFDSSLGILNSVNLLVELNVSGYASLSTPEEVGFYAVFKVTLDEIPELGWDQTVASCEGYADPLYQDEYSGEWQSTFSDSGNAYRGPDTIFENFGRFLGPDPFEVGLTLFGDTSTEGTGQLISAYDGNARMEYWYDYTVPEVVPEPSGLLTLLLGLPGLAGFARLKRK